MRWTRLLQATAAALAVAVGAESGRLAFGDDWYAFGDTSTWSAVLGLTAGAALLVAGIAQLRSASDRTQGALLVGAGLGWLVTAWDSPAAAAWIFLAGRILGSGWPVVVAHAVLRSYGPLGPGTRAAVIGAYAATFGPGLAAALVFNPAASGCVDCPVSPVLLADRPSIAGGLDRAATLAGPIWAVVLVAFLLRRLIGATSARRRVTLPMTTVGLLLLATVTAGHVRSIARGLPETDDVIWWTAASGLLVLLALCTGWPAVSLALTRHRLAELVVQSSAVPVVGGLALQLGRALNDPSARLLYQHAGATGDELIDATGVPTRPSAELTPLTRGSDTVAFLDHTTSLDDHESAVIAQVVRLSLDHERLSAERAAQLRELRASRARIVAAADRERRQLERDLHDGAQQRMVSLALALQLAELTAGAAAGSKTQVHLAEARTEITDALSELRTIARGLYPRELADEGLESALETFAETDPTPVSVDCDVPDRLPQAVESAAYFTVAHFLATRGYLPIEGRAIRAWRERAFLQLELAGSTRADLTRAEDRVGALGGVLERSADGSIRIALPCAS
jgi:signal transduction histidine kinase